MKVTDWKQDHDRLTVLATRAALLNSLEGFVRELLGYPLTVEDADAMTALRSVRAVLTELDRVAADLR